MPCTTDSDYSARPLGSCPISSMMALVDPNSIRLKQRAAKGKDTINGVKLSPLSTTQANARKIVEHRVDATIEALKKAMAAQK